MVNLLKDLIKLKKEVMSFRELVTHSIVTRTTKILWAFYFNMRFIIASSVEKIKFMRMQLKLLVKFKVLKYLVFMSIREVKHYNFGLGIVNFQEEMSLNYFAVSQKTII